MTRNNQQSRKGWHRVTEWAGKWALNVTSTIAAVGILAVASVVFQMRDQQRDIQAVLKTLQTAGDAQIEHFRLQRQIDAVEARSKSNTAELRRLRSKQEIIDKLIRGESEK